MALTYPHPETVCETERGEGGGSNRVAIIYQGTLTQCKGGRVQWLEMISDSRSLSLMALHAPRRLLVTVQLPLIMS